MRRSASGLGLVVSGCLRLAPVGAHAAGTGVLTVSGGSVATIVIDAPAPSPDGFAEVSAGPGGRCFRWTGRAVVHSNVAYDLYASIRVPAALDGRLVDRPSLTPACAVSGIGSVTGASLAPWEAARPATAARSTEIAIDVLVAPDDDAAAVLAQVQLAVWAAAAI